MNCSNCTIQRPIQDQGYISLRSSHRGLSEELLLKGYNVTADKQGCRIAYQTKEELLNLIQWLRIQREHESMKVCVEANITLPESPDRPIWIPLFQLEARFKHIDVVDIIMNEHFTSHMQPIVSAAEDIIGFEFLLRPSSSLTPFQPYQLFETARKTGLHSFLDRAARISAIETSAAHVPKGFKRFINFLPSSIYNPKYCLTHTFEAIERLNQNPDDFVFEVVETEEIQSMDNLNDIFDEYRKHGISVALDDVGSGYSTLQEMSRLKPDYVKIDRSLVDGCSQDKHKQMEIRHIIERTVEFGGIVLAEGIEQREDFEFCRSEGATLAQGYLFGKPQAEPANRARCT